MKQTTVKNKQLSLNLPKTAYYTLKELFALNEHFNAEITVRVRHSNMIEQGKVVHIGDVHGGKGRPCKVYALAPVTQNTINKAKQDGIIMVENADKLVNVVKVTPQAAPVNPLAATTTATTPQTTTA